MVIFWGLKFDIFTIPNFLATFYVLGSPVDNDLKRESWRDVSTVLVVETVISYSSLGSSPNIFREHMAPLFSDLREERLVIGTIITITIILVLQ